MPPWELAGRNLQVASPIWEALHQRSMSKKPEMMAGAYLNSHPHFPQLHLLLVLAGLPGRTPDLFYLLAVFGTAAGSPSGPISALLWVQLWSCWSLAARLRQVLEKGCFGFWLKQQPFCLQSWQWSCSSSLYIYKLYEWQPYNFLIKHTSFILTLTASNPRPVKDWQMPSVFISSSILAFLYFNLPGGRHLR